MVWVCCCACEVFTAWHPSSDLRICTLTQGGSSATFPSVPIPRSGRTCSRQRIGSLCHRYSSTISTLEVHCTARPRASCQFIHKHTHIHPHSLEYACTFSHTLTHCIHCLRVQTQKNLHLSDTQTHIHVHIHIHTPHIWLLCTMCLPFFPSSYDATQCTYLRK